MKPADLLTILENQEKNLTETGVEDGSGKIIFPIVRRLYPKMITDELVSVNPMRRLTENVESVLKMVNGLVQEGIVKGEYDFTQSSNIYYIKPEYGKQGSS